MNSCLSNHDWNNINETIFAMNSEKDVSKAMELFLSCVYNIMPYDKASIIYFSYYQKKFCVETFISKNYTGDEVKSYNAYYYGMDDILDLMFQKNIMVGRSSDLVDYSERMKTEYYCDYIKPSGTHFSLDANFNWHKNNNVQSFGSLDFFRSERSRDFSDREFQICQVLQPHLELKASQYIVEYEDLFRDMLGSYLLTKCESEVALLIAKGYSNEEIGIKLYISVSTVKKHVSNIFEKMNIKSRNEFLRMIK